LICTKFKFRNLGYASLLLNGFIKYIQNKSIPSINSIKYKQKIILSSVEESVIFYERYGFIWTRESLNCHTLLMEYEKYSEEKEYFIMELEIT
jgi:ribosomal protein S18 acetylase RimI-like enzyme